MALRDREWQTDMKRRSPAVSSTFNPHRAAVQLDQVSNDRETDAQTAMLTRGTRFTLAEAIEHVGQKLGIDAAARIAHDDFHLRFQLFETHLDAPAAGGELDGVGQEVPDNLLEPVAIA